MELNLKRQQKNLERKEAIARFAMRWWLVGAVYFFIGWGTGVGQYASPIDFIVLLGIVTGLANTLILNPVYKMLYNVSEYKPYLEMTLMGRVWMRIKEVLIAIVIVFLVYLIYQGINISAIKLLGLSQETVFLPGEPILFGLFYTLINQARLVIKGKLRKRK